jgi:hypothetical protein
VEVRRRASEAKGPFPGGKRVGSWGKNKSESKREMKVIQKQEAHPAKWMSLKLLK